MATHYWLVTLRLRLGDYEKYTTQVVHTTSKAKAGYMALCDETHNEPLSRRAYDKGEEWWDDGWMYELYDTRPIEPDHVTILKGYGI